jgi:hypothetical protein
MDAFAVMDDALTEAAAVHGWTIRRLSGRIGIVDDQGRTATARVHRAKGRWWLTGPTAEGSDSMLCGPQKTLTAAFDSCRWDKLALR